LEPANKRRLQVRIRGGTGDADLFVRRLSPVTRNGFDCRPGYRGGNGHAETCNWRNPLNGVWFIEIDGYTDYANLTLRVRG
jgi:serine protease